MDHKSTPPLLGCEPLSNRAELTWPKVMLLLCAPEGLLRAPLASEGSTA